MPDIRHRVGIAAPQHRLYEMLSTKNGLAEFRTKVEGDSQVGGKLSFFFANPEPSAVMEAAALCAPGTTITHRHRHAWTFTR
jgi:hypothetical protein